MKYLALLLLVGLFSCADEYVCTTCIDGIETEIEELEKEDTEESIENEENKDDENN